MKTRLDFGKLCEAYNIKGIGVEVGVQYGTFSKIISNHYTGKICCVDIWEDIRILNEAQKNLNTEQFKMMIGDSVEVSDMFDDESLDFVYIDANHFYDYVLSDMYAWYPKVRPGGIFAGHDYCVFKDIEVIPAVDRFFKIKKLDLNLTTEDYFEGNPFPTWWTIKQK